MVSQSCIICLFWIYWAKYVDIFTEIRYYQNSDLIYMVYKIVGLAVELEFKQYMYFNYIVENSSIGKEYWTAQENNWIATRKDWWYKANQIMRCSLPMYEYELFHSKF
jgi:hypothetical protein